MRTWLQRETHRLFRALRQVDAQVAAILVLAPALVLVQQTVGSRQFYWQHLNGWLFSEKPSLGAWGWWFGTQGVTGFIVPVAVLMLFGRRPREIGLGSGDTRLALTLAGAYLPLVIAGAWVLSAEPAFQAQYPHYNLAAKSWRVFLIYEALFLCYWIGWEYLWRGFVMFGTAPQFGYMAIFVQMVPFALLHLDKPPPEAALSIVGGLALGALVWRCRSFWIAVPIHAAQMLILDFWCALRARSGAEGIGLHALARALGL